MKRDALKWKRATIIWPTDHIISSNARAIGDNGFRPKYEQNPVSNNIGFLLSNEYMRLWYIDRAEYQKNNYSVQENAFSEAQRMRRRFVQRLMVKPVNPRKQREMPIIKMRKFQNIAAKVDSRLTDAEKKRLCPRYAKTFEELSKEQRYKPVCPKPSIHKK